MPQHKTNLSSGFTVFEVIVAAFIFSFMVISISGIAAYVFNIQRRAFAIQKIQESSMFILESMAKEIRVSSISPTTCGGLSNCIVNDLSITHPVNGPVNYRLSGANIIRNARGEDNPPGSAVDTVISSASDVDVSRLNFLINGLGIDCRQLRTTIIMRIQNKSGDPILIDVQTTVASRDITEELANPQTSCP